MEAQCARFEAGQVYLPKDAPWLSEFLREVFAFPNARHNDQVDSVSQFWNWAEPFNFASAPTQYTTRLSFVPSGTGSS